MSNFFWWRESFPHTLTVRDGATHIRIWSASMTSSFPPVKIPETDEEWEVMVNQAADEIQSSANTRQLFHESFTTSSPPIETLQNAMPKRPSRSNAEAASNAPDADGPPLAPPQTSPHLPPLPPEPDMFTASESNTQSYARTGDAELELPLRLVLSELQWFNGSKSLILFLIFYIVYLATSIVRLDWWEGHKTLKWLDEAHKTAGITPLQEHGSIHGISNYLDRVGTVSDELHFICSNCEVGITPHSRDMQFLTLTDFICSDFSSTAGSDHYPTRDCLTEDARWVANPTPYSAPCCKNSTLVTASMGMMTEHLKCELLASEECIPGLPISCLSEC